MQNTCSRTVSLSLLDWNRKNTASYTGGKRVVSCPGAGNETRKRGEGGRVLPIKHALFLWVLEHPCREQNRSCRLRESRVVEEGLETKSSLVVFWRPLPDVTTEDNMGGNSGEPRAICGNTSHNTKGYPGLPSYQSVWAYRGSSTPWSRLNSRVYLLHTQLNVATIAAPSCLEDWGVRRLTLWPGCWLGDFVPRVFHVVGKLPV